MEFRPNDAIGKGRYYWDGEDYEKCFSRVAITTAEVELPEKRQEWKDKFSQAMIEGRFAPAGRNYANAGRSESQRGNCFAKVIEDDIEDIFYKAAETGIILKHGGGVGLNFSKVRPKDTQLSSGGIASGPISFMDVYDVICSTIVTGGQRRGALLGVLHYNHPDIMDFIRAKQDHKKLNNFNISVGIDSEFIDSVLKNKTIPLVHDNKIHGTIKAKKLWDTFIEGVLASGEPGFLNIGLIKEYANTWYFEDVCCTNPCGEATLSNDNACILGSLNLSAFVKDGAFSFEDFKSSIITSIRFLDNVIDCTWFPVPNIKQVLIQSRGIGLGIMGWAHTLIKMGMEYGSEESYELFDRIMEFLRNTAYETSVDLAIEKRPFPKFDATSYGNSKFIRSLPHKLQKRIKKHGIRNARLLAIAPTGTISAFFNTSRGFAPIFAARYLHKGNLNKVFVDPLWSRYLAESKKKAKEVEHLFRNAYEVGVEQYLEYQAIAQKYVDNSIATTIALPQDYKGDIGQFLLKYMGILKGGTVYREGSREDAPLVPLDKWDVQEGETVGTLEDDCNGGVCNV